MLQKKLSAAFVSGFLGLVSAGFATSAHADETAMFPGLYIGAEAGYADVDYGVNTKSDNTHKVTTHDDDLGGRAYIGFNFNPYLALEGGYSYLPDNKYKVTDLVTGTVNKSAIQTAMWDIVGKFSLPLDNMPSTLYAKAGAGYVNSDLKLDGRKVHTDDNWLPIAGVGANYKLNCNLGVDISYTHAFGSNSSHNLEPDIDFAAIGLTYNF